MSGRAHRIGDLRSHEPTVRCPITRAHLMVRARHLPPAEWHTSALATASLLPAASATDRRLGQRLSAAARHPPGAAAARGPGCSSLGLPAADGARERGVDAGVKRLGGVVRMRRGCRADRPAGRPRHSSLALLAHVEQVITGSVTSAWRSGA